MEAQADVPDSMLRLYQEVLTLRENCAVDEEVRWDHRLDQGPVLAFWRGGYVLVMVNTGEVPVPLPEGEVMVASVPLEGRTLPGDSAVWLHREP